MIRRPRLGVALLALLLAGGLACHEQAPSEQLDEAAEQVIPPDDEDVQ